MFGPHQKFSSPSLLTKQHPFSFSLLFSLQTFPSSLKSTHPNIVLVNRCGLNLCFPMAFEQSTRFLWRKSDDMSSYFCGGNQALLAIGDTDSDNHTGRGEQAYIYIYIYIYLFIYTHTYIMHNTGVQSRKVNAYIPRAWPKIQVQENKQGSPYSRDEDEWYIV